MSLRKVAQAHGFDQFTKEEKTLDFDELLFRHYGGLYKKVVKYVKGADISALHDGITFFYDHTEKAKKTESMCPVSTDSIDGYLTVAHAREYVLKKLIPTTKFKRNLIFTYYSDAVKIKTASLQDVANISNAYKTVDKQKQIVRKRRELPSVSGK